MPPLTDEVTFASSDIWMSEFRLSPTDPRWRQIGATTDQATLIAIPRTTVGIRHEGREEVVADPTCAVFYAPGQRYRRRLLTPVGDDCTVIAISAELGDQLGLPSGRAGRLPFVAVSLGARGYLSAHRARHLAMRGASATLSDEIREELFWLLSGLMRGRSDDGRGTAAARSGTRREHRALTHAVRERLGRSMAHGPSLDELAAETATSPYHLARVFRSSTGQPIHRYLTDLRLRASLAPIGDGVRLADVAQQLGFASHAHLTDRFRRAYGVSPAAWRAGLRSRSAQSSKIMEAGGARPSVA